MIRSSNALDFKIYIGTKILSCQKVCSVGSQSCTVMFLLKVVLGNHTELPGFGGVGVAIENAI